MTTYTEALQEQLKAELDLFGEAATVREVGIKVLAGSSRQHQQMKQAGHYNDTSIEVVALPLSYYDETEAPYEVHEMVSYKSKDFLIKAIEELEQEHGFKLVLELMK